MYGILAFESFLNWNEYTRLWNIMVGLKLIGPRSHSGLASSATAETLSAMEPSPCETVSCAGSGLSSTRGALSQLPWLGAAACSPTYLISETARATACSASSVTSRGANLRTTSFFSFGSRWPAEGTKVRPKFSLWSSSPSGSSAWTSGNSNLTFSLEWDRSEKTLSYASPRTEVSGIRISSSDPSGKFSKETDWV